MEFILKVLAGFIIMCILIVISAIPILVLKHYKKDWGSALKWIMWVVCVLIYTILSALCQSVGLLTERRGIPIPFIPMLVLYLLAGFNFNKKIKTDTQVVKDDNSETTNSNKIFFSNGFKVATITLSVLCFGVGSFLAYDKVNTEAYNSITYSINAKEVDVLNDKLNEVYEEQMAEYNKDVELFRNTPVRLREFYPMPDKPTKPELYSTESAIIGMYPQGLEILGCYYWKYSMFKTSCGDIQFTSNNLVYEKIHDDVITSFNPYLKLCMLLVLVLIVSVVFSGMLVYLMYLMATMLKKLWHKIKGLGLPKTKLKLHIKSSITSKLEELNELKNKGLITEEDYNAKKQSLLDDF